MKLLATAALILAITLPQFASAHPTEADYSKEYRRCAAKDSSNGGRGKCLEAELVRQEAAMQKMYNLATTSADAEMKKLIIAAQKSWTSFRSQNCDMLASLMAGGSGYGISRTSCMVDMTIYRTGELDAMVG